MYQPVLALMENIYELTSDRNFVVVFAIPEQEREAEGDYTFVYADPFFNIGNVQFSFPEQKIRAARNLRVNWN